MGSDCGRYNVGALNVAIGTECMEGVSGSTDGDQNVAIGYQAMHDMTTGDYNTCLGSKAGAAIPSGYDNTFVGQKAGDV